VESVERTVSAERFSEASVEEIKTGITDQICLVPGGRWRSVCAAGAGLKYRCRGVRQAVCEFAVLARRLSYTGRRSADAIPASTGYFS
jgi:hypothetical protein